MLVKDHSHLEIHTILQKQKGKMCKKHKTYSMLCFEVSFQVLCNNVFLKLFYGLNTRKANIR